MSKFCRDQVTSIIDKAFHEAKVPGLSFAIMQRGKTFTVLRGQASPASGIAMRTSSRFELSCIMKFLLSLVVLEFVTEGLIDLDEPIGRYIPELAGYFGADLLQVRHLLSHTSGYRGLDITDMDVRWKYSWPRFVSFFNSTERLFAPGAIFNYEHSEHVILGAILARQTGKKPGELVRERILAPCSVSLISCHAARRDPSTFAANTMFHRSLGKFVETSSLPLNEFWNASLPDLTSTPLEICQIATSLLIKDGAWENVAPLHEKTITLLRETSIKLPHADTRDDLSESLPKHFGLACAHYDDELLGHNGSALGQTCGVRIDLKNDAVFAIGLNAWVPRLRDRVLNAITDHLRGGRPTTPIEKEQDLPQEFSGRYLGSYFGEVNIVQQGGEVLLYMGKSASSRREPARIIAGSRGLQIDTDTRTPVSFKCDNEGRVEVLFLGMHSYRKVADVSPIRVTPNGTQH